VRNGRATTWKECADKYEEQLHRWKMENKVQTRPIIVNEQKGGNLFGLFFGVLDIFLGAVEAGANTWSNDR